MTKPLKEMAASVAHEVRNPLNSIKLLLDRVKAATARLLGIDRNRLRYKLEKFGIE